MSRIVVVGCGAMGSIYAGLLADGGNEVWAVDLDAAHVAAINGKGLRVEGASGDRVVKLAGAVTSPSLVDGGPVDWVLLATKASGVVPAATAIRDSAIFGPDTVVCTIQNGLGSAEQAASVLGADRVVIGVVGGFGASMVAPGHVHHNGWELVRLGELDGPVTPRVEALAGVWLGSHFNVKTYDNPHKLIWEKLICNAAFSGPCTLMTMTVGDVLANADAWSVSAGCAVEAFQVARAKGIPVEIDDPEAYVRAFGEKIPGARPSMLLDHLAGRRSEIDAINGAIPLKAAEVGLAAPVNRTVARLIRARETRFT